MKLFNFMRLYGDPLSIVQRLRDDGLIVNSMVCGSCGAVMTENTTSMGDGCNFACWKRTCRKRKSIRAGSFFEQSRLGLCDSMLFLHLWAKGYQERLIIDDFDFCKKTVVDWSRFCRELCVYEFESEVDVIGGIGTIVELDETLAVKRKYEQGRMLRAGWLFGGIERRDDGEFKCFMKLVYDRSEAHLTHFIRTHVAPGTHIMTDGWSAYRNLASMGYTHSVVIHEENFVSPTNNLVHTQRIEATWSSLKRFIRAHGGNKGGFYLEYIAEYIFRRKNSDVFNATLTAIRNKYAIN